MTVGPVPSPTSSFPEQPILVRPLPDPSAMTRMPADPTERRPPNIKLQHKSAKEPVANNGGRRLDFGS